MERILLFCDACPPSKAKRAAGQIAMATVGAPRITATVDLCRRHLSETLSMMRENSSICPVPGCGRPARHRGRHRNQELTQEQPPIVQQENDTVPA